MKKNEIEYLMYLQNRIKAVEKDLSWFIEEITLRQFREADLRANPFPYCPEKIWEKVRQ